MNYRTSNIALLFGFIAFFVSSAPVSADSPVIRTGDTVGVEAEQILEGDFYALGRTVTISGQAEHDVYILGGAVTSNAPIEEDLVVVGGTVQVHGTVADDVRIVGGEVVIAEPVVDDVVIVGGTVHILSTASIGGDLIFLGGEVRIDGPVLGTVFGTGEAIRIDARVGGDVSVRAGQSLTLGDKADIQGDIQYASPSELSRAQNAVVSGAITYDDKLFIPEETHQFRPLILNVLVLVFSGLAIFFVLRSRTARLVETIFDGYGRLGLIGLGMFLAIPIVAVILMASVIGFVVGAAILLGYSMLLMTAFMCLPILFGSLFQRALRLGTALTINTIVLGVFVVFAIPFIPVLGGFILFVGFLMILGGIYSELYRFFKSV
jgi:hypothetical protein